MERKPNVCYSRYISLFIKNLLGDNYNNNNLKTLKPHHITASSFKTPSTFEVPLTSHMLKVAKISKEQYHSLILSSEKVNTNDSVDKSLSRTNVQPVTQSKATTDTKSRKKRIPSFYKPKTLKGIKESSSTSQVVETQHVKETVATLTPLRV
nr:hypothetical protein [Tanacetum cinerariifolium]